MGPNEITDKFVEIYEPRISPRNAGFLNEMRKANPAGAELLDRNAAKANIAMVARGMRVAIQITQEQLSERSGLTQALISRIEAPTGSMPTIETLMKYVEGFGGHLGLLFGSEVSERPVTSATKVKKHVMTIGERLAKVKMAGKSMHESFKERDSQAPEDEPPQKSDPAELYQYAREDSSNFDQAIARLV